MLRTLTIGFFGSAVVILLSGCERHDEHQHDASGDHASKSEHVHDDGSTHADHDASEHEGAEDHDHDEIPLGSALVGDVQVELAQGHGKIEAGKEGHLVVKLPYNDKGQTIVRAWIGTEDRLRSVVGKGQYAPSHDDYDIHAVAPTPLPDDVMWWIEIEKPDGTRLVGSAKPF